MMNDDRLSPFGVAGAEKLVVLDISEVGPCRRARLRGGGFCRDRLAAHRICGDCETSTADGGNTSQGETDDSGCHPGCGEATGVYGCCARKTTARARARAFAVRKAWPFSSSCT